MHTLPLNYNLSSCYFFLIFRISQHVFVSMAFCCSIRNISLNYNIVQKEGYDLLDQMVCGIGNCAILWRKAEVHTMLSAFCRDSEDWKRPQCSESLSKASHICICFLCEAGEVLTVFFSCDYTNLKILNLYRPFGSLFPPWDPIL